MSIHNFWLYLFHGLLLAKIDLEHESLMSDVLNGTFFTDLKDAIESEIQLFDEIDDPDYRHRVLALQMEWRVFESLIAHGTWNVDGKMPSPSEVNAVAKRHGVSVQKVQRALKQSTFDERRWRRKAGALQIAVAWAYKIGCIYTECLVVRNSQHLESVRRSQAGSRKGAAVKHDALPQFRKVAVEEFLRLRKEHPKWARTRICNATAEIQQVKDARLQAIEADKHPKAGTTKEAISKAVERAVKMANQW